MPAGRGSGKTELAKRRLVLALAEEKPHSTPRYFYAAPTRDQAKRVAWDHFKALIPTNWLREKPMESELKITTIFGSELWVLGMDRPARFEGIQWDGGVVDESCDQQPKAFELSIVPTLVWRNGWCWRIGVPKRKGPAAAEFRKYFERAQRGELADTAAFTWPSRSIVPKDMLEHARATLDLKDFLEQFEALFQTAGGGIFHAFDRQENVKKVEYHSNRMIVVGSDFNVDPMAWVIGHAYDNRIEWFDELFIRDCNTGQALDTLWQRYQDHTGGWEFYGDSTARQRKTSASESDYLQIENDARFQKAGRMVSYPSGPPPIEDRLASCNAMLCNAARQRRMFIDPQCEHLIEDLETRYYLTGTKKPADPKGSLMGHITDAMGYAVFSLFPVALDAPAESYEVTVQSR